MQIDAFGLSLLAAREGVAVRWYVWLEARTRDTGAPATVGFWSGRDPVSLSVAGETRVYLGIGGLLRLDPLTFEPGPVVREQVVGLTMISPEVENAMRGYDPRMAKVDIHLGLHDPSSHALLSLPRAFRGEVDTGPIRTPTVGGQGGVELRLVSAARAMTRTLTAKYSDAAFRQRQGDRIARYADVSGAVQVVWGEKRG